LNHYVLIFMRVLMPIVLLCAYGFS